MKNGGKNKSVAFIILVNVYILEYDIIHQCPFVMTYNTQTNHDLAKFKFDWTITGSCHFTFSFINQLKIKWDRQAYFWSNLDLRFVSFYKSNYITEKLDAK